MIFRNRRILAYIPPALVIILIIAFLPAFTGLEVSDILAYSPESPLPAALVILAMYCLKSVVVVIPLTALYVSAGIMFSAGWAISLTCLGLFCEMSIGYFTGKRLGGEKVAALLEKNDKAKRLHAFNKQNSPSMCFLTRFMPLPFDLVNMFFGASAVKYPQFIVFTFLGLAPKMIPYVLIGDSIANPLSMEFLIPFVISAAVSIFAFVTYRKWQENSEETAGCK